MREVPDKEKIKTHVLCSITFFFFFENRAVYEIIWKYDIEPDWPQMIIWRMFTACWITKATNIHSEYVILIFCTNVLNVTLYAHCLSCLLYQLSFDFPCSLTRFWLEDFYMISITQFLDHI